MPGNLDYDAVLKTVLSWPRRDQTALLHAVVDDLASGAAEHPEPPEKPALAPPLPPTTLYVPINPAPPPVATMPSPAPKKEGGKPWVDETST